MENKNQFKNIHHLLSERAKTSKVFLIDPRNDQKITYEEVNEIANKTAHFLLSLGIKKDDKVAVISRNYVEFIYLFFACGKIGAVFHPINTDLLEEELEYALDNSDSVCVFADEKNCEKVKKLQLPKLKNTFSIKYLENISEFEETFEDPGITEEDNCVFMYSSGTTGKPKGIVLTQKNVLYGGQSIARGLHLKESTINFINLPLFFSGGLFPNLVGTTCSGGTCIVPEKFSKSSFWKIVDKYQVNWTFLVPTMISYLLNPSEDVSSYNTKSLQFVCCGAAPTPVELMKKFKDAFGVPLLEIYGLTENTAWTTISDINNLLPGSIGKPMDIAEMKVVDDTGKEVENSVEGEILIKGPHIFKEYYKNKKATDETIRDDWLYSGDLGYKDDEENYFISGRKKFIIIKGGQNISPRYIDEVFYKHPAVVDAATIGIPDEMYGEEIKTYVVLKNGKTISEKELLAYCSEHLDEFKRPKEIRFIDKIPKGPSGKLLGRMLLEKHLKEN